MDEVLTLSNRLRNAGIDCYIDQYEESPAEGWPRWMVNQIEDADFVLVVCTENYERRFRGKDETGKGLVHNQATFLGMTRCASRSQP
jgi:TIR domain